MQDDQPQKPNSKTPVDPDVEDFNVSDEEQHLDDMFDLSTQLEDYADAEEEETKKMKEEIEALQQSDNTDND